jgi:hypothetical protein
MDTDRRILGAILLPGHVPRRTHLQCLEVHLEELGTSPGKKIHWLANKNRCWTADRLRRRRLQCNQCCPLCDQAPETLQHILIACPFSKEVWHEILHWLRIPCQPPNNEPTLNDWWLTARQTTPKVMRKGLATATHLTAWMIWKQRNSCTFEGEQPSVRRLVDKIKAEATLWAKAGAAGLRVVFPPTWDVH